MDVEPWRDSDREAQYRESGDVACAVLAIGESPAAPPPWAVEACRQHAEAEDAATGGYLSEMDAALMDAMADHFLSAPLARRNVHAAAVAALGGPTKADASAVRRLTRHWRHHTRRYGEVSTNRWLLRAGVRRFRAVVLTRE